MKEENSNAAIMENLSLSRLSGLVDEDHGKGNFGSAVFDMSLLALTSLTDQ